MALCFFRALSLSGAWDDVISSSLLHTTPVKREVRGRVTGEERMVCETYTCTCTGMNTITMYRCVPAYHSVKCGGWSDVGCGGWSQVYHLKGESYGCRHE